MGEGRIPAKGTSAGVGASSAGSSLPTHHPDSETSRRNATAGIGSGAAHVTCCQTQARALWNGCSQPGCLRSSPTAVGHSVRPDPALPPEGVFFPLL